MRNPARTAGRPAAGLALAFVILTFGPAPAARADGVQVVLSGSHVVRVSSGGYSVDADRLVTGASQGDVSSIKAPDFPVLAADDFNLESYFARAGQIKPEWDVLLGDWRDTNGGAVDFFLFEVGGNDSVQVAPILLNGSIGAFVGLSGWTPTGYSAVNGPNKGQMVHGLAFRASDLRYASGAPLAPGERISGVRFSSDSVDGAVFAAVSANRPKPPQNRMQKPVHVAGTPRKWSPMEIWYQGPPASELDQQPNPFLDYRLAVTFTSPSGARHDVPGFFDGDGRGGAQGNVWKVRFTPGETGDWTAQASFRQGTSIAISLVPGAGQPTGFDGTLVSFAVKGVSASASGFHRKGMLRAVGQHYLRFEDGSWFLKGGTNSPENLLAYFGFDDIGDSGNIGLLHRYTIHRADWKQGDPDWTSATTGEDGRGLIGALNYLSQQGVNSAYMLPMNLGGDGQDVSPFVGQDDTDFDKTHYDLSRLAQWNIVFEHAQSKGIQLHFVLAETEPKNETWLDGGGLGLQRKLFFREMVARFGHNNAIKWNLCEENDWSPTQLSAFADYIKAQDPYDHPIAVHNHPNKLTQYSQLAGNPRFAATSCQFDPNLAGSQVESLRGMSSQAGHRWAVDMDENTPASTGLSPTNANDLRKRVLWDVYFSGGAGVEWYFGYQPNPVGGDVDAESFKNRQPMWGYMRIARNFIETWLPFSQMSARDGLLSGESSAYGGGEVFAQKGEVYAVYLPNGSATGVLDLSEAPVPFLKRWFNPRTGTIEGSAKTVQGGLAVTLGTPPSAPGEDWVVWFERK